MAARSDGENAQNAVVVALANKLARMAWAVLRHGKRFRIDIAAAA